MQQRIIDIRINLNWHYIAAQHLTKCKKVLARPIEEPAPSGMLDSLGLVPRTSSEV